MGSVIKYLGTNSGWSVVVVLDHYLTCWFSEGIMMIIIFCFFLHFYLFIYLSIYLSMWLACVPCKLVKNWPIIWQTIVYLRPLEWSWWRKLGIGVYIYITCYGPACIVPYLPIYMQGPGTGRREGKGRKSCLFCLSGLRHLPTFNLIGR